MEDVPVVDPRRGLAVPRGRTGRRGSLALVVAALLFSSTFLVVKGAVQHASPLAFLAARFVLAAAVLAPVARRRLPTPGELRHGLLGGSALLAGYVLQTYGLRSTTTSRSAFLTYLLVVIVPVLEAVVTRRPPRARTVLAVAVAVVGLLLLTAPGGGGQGFGAGEALTLVSAVCFAAHIVVLGRVAHRHDPVRLTLVQLLVVGGACLVPGLLDGLSGFGPGVWVAVAYTGVAATAVAFVLMVSGQRTVPAHRASLILLLEPVAAAALGVARGEAIGARGLVGGAVIFVAIVLAERAHQASASTSSTVGAA